MFGLVMTSLRNISCYCFSLLLKTFLSSMQFWFFVHTIADVFFGEFRGFINFFDTDSFLGKSDTFF